MDVVPLHTLHDGSKVLRMPVSTLLATPVWQGNRIINYAHVEAIVRSIKKTDVKMLDFGYRTVKYTETDASGKDVVVRMIVDGQHRREVLKQYFNDPTNLTSIVGDFEVIVIEKEVTSELEIIEYFNTINAVNPITWSDKNLIVNAYIAELESAFNSVKLPMIRKGATRRPYLSVDKLRQALVTQEGKLQTRTSEIKEFVQRVQNWNKNALTGAEIQLLGITDTTEATMLERCIEKKCMLSYDPKLEWIQKCL